ncbi:type I restriction endonuclease subunit R [Clostridium sporogenes]|uniref:type I restriction endonuclease subunit R n=1 Tax=Clostridium sporogenes TaxID=1509 RepID=UPI0013C85B8A|nr:type I restriction endonuclease [Clostridium sporogenes]NFT02180.1 type I restriction endonuclease subunit R [Clostridium sporogenes]NFT31706.1 type I restriction endonuclease subunit R [Clostridium sporogenes]NFT38166.1 type I restriction endonuclease subunit R [Clostridium sporogenes]NFT52743.1 type I restriction endonuclease subunit R [Clostridium sporogenes]NFT74123.1 type I restriction endonuclease subunit R [Clostridium sporogenes]
MISNTKEEKLETLTVNYLQRNNGYELGSNIDYNKEYAIDENRLFKFLKETQPEKLQILGVLSSEMNKVKFLNKLQDKIIKDGIINVLRNGFKIYPVNLDLYYLIPTEENSKAAELYSKNIFSVIRQLKYSRDNTKFAIDCVIFINGLPIITCEFKNNLTKQNLGDAAYRYKIDRNPKETLFGFGRCMVHFAVDDNEIKMCTKLNGKKSLFSPFNKGYNNGAGNPPNPNGIKTDYLWKKILSKNELSNIIENYAQIIEEKDEETKRINRKQVFPRFHQLSVVEAILNDVKDKGIGQKYLIQHSVGSGKSNSIVWLSHKLVDVKKRGKNIFDSIIIVTDRINLDKQIKNTIKGFVQMRNTVGHADSSGDLRKLLENGKKIIITTVHKFPYILNGIGNDHRKSNFGIIIDEAHSSQSGNMSAKMNMTLSEVYDESDEDKILKILEGRKMLTNASYFAFTATPKNKTLEMFGISYKDNGKIKHRPFHVYTMKQAIEEGFIIDVLKNYTTINSYYKLAKSIEDDPLFDKKKTQNKLRRYVESNEKAIELKAEIMIDHFLNQVIAKGKVGGKARAMVVTGSKEKAIRYYYAISDYLVKRKTPYKAIVAFSGEYEFGGESLSESSINGFPSNEIEMKLRHHPYRILVVANKFQTGYDEPFLHTMYVDKVITDINAVQTLSRLNRAHPQKYDTFIWDFANDINAIKEAFSKYYQTTILSDETDPSKLNEIKREIKKYEVFSDYHVKTIVYLYLNGAGKEQLDPLLDVCVKTYKEDLDEDEQVNFRSKAKAFIRNYGFLASILPYGNSEWEKLCIFLNMLIPKLPTSQREEDDSKGILESIDLDSYRAEAQATISIVLEDKESYEINPVVTSNHRGVKEPKLDLLSNRLSNFHELFGSIPWENEEGVKKQIARIPEMVAKDKEYQNAMKNSDKQNAKIESQKALNKVMISLMSSNMEIFKQFNDNSSFNQWLSDMVFNVTYNTKGEVYSGVVTI